MVTLLFACYVLIEVLRILSSTWLSIWTDQSMSKDYRPGFYILIYAFLSSGQVCANLSILSINISNCLILLQKLILVLTFHVSSQITKGPDLL